MVVLLWNVRVIPYLHVLMYTDSVFAKSCVKYGGEGSSQDLPLSSKSTVILISWYCLGQNKWQDHPFDSRLA